jgi:putative ABC transport system permease protein
LMRARLAREPRVISVSAADINMGRGRDGSSQTSIMGFDYKDRSVKTHWQLIDYDFLQTFGIQLLQGRDFSREYGADSLAVVINEQMAKQLGEKEVIGTMLPVSERTKYQVIGVVKDFHFKSLHREIAPLTMTVRRDWYLQYIFVRVQPGAMANSLEMVQKAWKEVDPRSRFEASFLDENTDRQYQKETKLSKIFMSGALLTILISCMGLFAIVLLVIVQRTREIGIRKVLGIAWYGMTTWLQDFAYRIQIQWWVFVLAGVVALLIAFITLSFQSIRAALKNPVKSLRTD